MLNLDYDFRIKKLVEFIEKWKSNKFKVIFYSIGKKNIKRLTKKSIRS